MNTENIIAKSLKVNFCYDNQEYTNIYLIESCDDHNIIFDISILIDEYKLPEWGIQLSNPFILNKSKVLTRDAIKVDLTEKIAFAMEPKTTLKLTN